MKHNFDKHTNPIFIETGSYTGDGIMAAIKANFNEIISIELSEKYFNLCKKRFKNNNNVKLYYGDSIDVLPKILNDINERCTFWLDGHFSGGDTALGKYSVPLFNELEIIKKHKIKNHTILIDDIRLLRNGDSEWNYLDFKLNDIENLIMSINQNYKIKYEFGMVDNDILVAYI